MVARAEAKERRGALAQVREDELAARAVLHRPRLARLRVDHLHVDEPVGAEVHAVLLLALAEERDADVPHSHRLGDLRAPALFEPRAERRLAAARLARDEDALDARLGKVRLPLDEVRRVGRGHHDRLRPQKFDRPQEPLGVSVPIGMCVRPSRSKAARAAPATHGPAL